MVDVEYSGPRITEDGKVCFLFSVILDVSLAINNFCPSNP